MLNIENHFVNICAFSSLLVKLAVWNGIGSSRMYIFFVDTLTNIRHDRFVGYQEILHRTTFTFWRKMSPFLIHMRCFA